MNTLNTVFSLPSTSPVFRRARPWPVHMHESRVRGTDSVISGATSDQGLLEAVLGGDDRAFRYLVERYQAHVARTVTGMLGKSMEVDDCVQDVFIRLFGSLSRYRGEATIKTYVTRIAINRSLDFLRKEKRSFFVPWDKTKTDLIESLTRGPDEDMVASDQRRQLRLALESLSPKHRAVVVLRLLDGLTTAETAEVLGVPYGTVLSRLKRALGKLKNVLASGAAPPQQIFSAGSAVDGVDDRIDEEAKS